MSAPTYSRRAGRVLGQPVAPSDVPRAAVDHEADECPRGPQPMKLADKAAVLFALAVSAGMVLWSVEMLVR
ncbi:MAG: hypothetical protein KA151_03175 [Piscinibacter sp.]|nr:hypothetical protein [Piscinibacter sp.]